MSHIRESQPTTAAGCVKCGEVGRHAATCPRSDGYTTHHIHQTEGRSDVQQAASPYGWVLADVQPSLLTAAMLDRYDNPAGPTVAMPDGMRESWKSWTGHTPDADESADVGGAAP